MKVAPEDIEVIDDVSNNGYVFTDGSGEIGIDLMIQVAR